MRLSACRPRLPPAAAVPRHARHERRGAARRPTTPAAAKPVPSPTRRRLRSTLHPASAVPVSSSPSPENDDEDDEDEACEVYVTPEGEVVEIMCGDYGFRSGFGRMYQECDGEIPAPAWELGWINFKKELKALRESVRFGAPGPKGSPSPSPSLVDRAAASALKAVSEAAFAADVRLEAAGVLPKLEAPLTKDRVVAADDDGAFVVAPSKAAAAAAAATGDAPGPKKISRSVAAVRKKLATLTLDDAAVWEREKARERSPGHFSAPWPVRLLYLSLCVFLDVVYGGRPIQRFWVLETVARMPYFAYISMLHLYESLGWWRAGAELRRVHFAEEWNELHHLQIMESLGGDARWADRALAAHASLFYYWGMVLAYLASPSLAYAFSELVEGHAVDTYTQFVEENEERLREISPPRVALEYYKSGDLYYFDELVTRVDDTAERRRPDVRNLYDVFCAIRDDEGEHISTMKSCRDSSIVGELAKRRKKLSGGGGGRGGSGSRGPVAGFDGSAVSGGNGSGRESGNGSAAKQPVSEEAAESLK